jgi:hypothetical protein
LGRSPSFDEITDAVVGSFERTLGVTFAVSGYSAEESDRAVEHRGEHEVSTVPRSA